MNGIIEQDVPQLNGCLAPPILSDEELLLEYRDGGCRTAFEELVHRYEKELFGYLRNYLGDAEMADDVFQQTFLQIYLKCDQFEPERKLRPWLYAVATNQAIDYQRRFGRHRMVSLDRRVGTDEESEAGAFVDVLDSRLRGPVEESLSHERAEMIRHAVDGLPVAVRQVVFLIYFQGMKYREAAHVLGIPVGTVKSRLHGAIHTLGEVLAAAHES
jgi:RNA polymerase sigma-70 factor (ECF subfamily)